MGLLRYTFIDIAAGYFVSAKFIEILFLLPPV